MRVSGFRFNPPAEELWRSNAIVSGRNRHYAVEPITGTLSIKTIISGTAIWETPDGRYEVSPDTCLVLNDGQTYGMEIESLRAVHTFCVFFRPGFVTEAAASSGSFGFYERLRLTPEQFAAPMARLRLLTNEGAMGGLEADEAMVDMALALIRSEAGPREEVSLKYAKSSTREEVFRQLNRARDFALGQLGSRLSLDELAGHACLSPFHFHRLHRQAFGETPHDFITRARLARGMRLLREGCDVGEVSLQLGFESVPTFTRLFKARTGQTPGAFRKIG